MALAVSCSGPKGWSVSGTVAGAEEGSSLALEACNAGRWYVLDSVRVGADGRFDYRAAELMPSVDILRLTLPGKGSVYFPVDGDDRLTLEAEAATFGTGHRLGGSDLASTVSTIDSIVAATPSLPDLQRKLAGFITSDTTGIVAYYAVGKSLDGKPVFNPADNFGNRIYGAAAQVYAHYHPLDAKGAALKQVYFEGRKALGRVPDTPEQVYEVPEASLIEIERYDDRGVKRSLAEEAAKGNVILLSFTDYGTQSSPAYNNVLNDLYALYHSKGLEIYQIAFDANEVEWKEAARNLPWITVWNAPEDGVGPLASYNVGVFPSTYIIDRKGEIRKRVTDPTDLPKEIAKYF